MKGASRYAAIAVAAGSLAAGLGVTSAAATARPNASSAQCHFDSGEVVLRSGISGSDVMQAQCEINFAWLNQFHNGGLVLDGRFGPKTKQATIGFQVCAGLTPDGVIGAFTWKALDTYVANGRSCQIQVTLPQ